LERADPEEEIPEAQGAVSVAATTQSDRKGKVLDCGAMVANLKLYLQHAKLQAIAALCSNL
jgi:hypothetical protein